MIRHLVRRLFKSDRGGSIPMMGRPPYCPAPEFVWTGRGYSLCTWCDQGMTRHTPGEIRYAVIRTE